MHRSNITFKRNGAALVQYLWTGELNDGESSEKIKTIGMEILKYYGEDFESKLGRKYSGVPPSPNRIVLPNDNIQPILK